MILPWQPTPACLLVWGLWFMFTGMGVFIVVEGKLLTHGQRSANIPIGSGNEYDQSTSGIETVRIYYVHLAHLY